MGSINDGELTLIARSGCFGLPTACPSCLPVYIYLRLSQVHFRLSYNVISPDSDEIPYIEDGGGMYVAYNNERGGVIEGLRVDRIVDLDGDSVCSIPEWSPTKAMIESWLGDALLYELWVAPDGSSAVRSIYYSGLPWAIGKLLFLKQRNNVMGQLGVQRLGGRRKDEIYRKAAIAYEALSTRLGGDEAFFFEDRPTSVDAAFLGHALITLQALPESSKLRRELLQHGNLIRYSENLKVRFLDSSSSSSPSSSSPAAAAARQPPTRGMEGVNVKEKETDMDRRMKRRAKYFLIAQFVGVIIFLSILGGDYDSAGLDEEADSYSYQEDA